MKKLLLCLFIGLSICGCKKDKNAPDNNSHSSNNQKVGSSAKDLLTADTYTSLNIVIQYMPGYTPNSSAVNNLKSFLQTYLHKPSGINIAEEQVAAGGSAQYSISGVKDIEDKDRTLYNTASTIAVNVLYVDGDSNEKGVLGTSYRNTSIVIFGKTIHDNSGAIGQVSREKLESTVLEHECGHILGLVDLGSPMQTDHQDPDHAHHCNNKDCLMYYASETTDALGFLISGSVPSLDANCQADLKAIGGK